MESRLVDLPRVRRLPDWKSWQALTALAPPFLSPEFFTLASRFDGDSAFVAEAWDGDRMVGALPLVRRGDRLTGLSCEYSPGYDYVGDSGAIAAMWAALHSDSGWNQLVFGKLPVGSPLATRLPTLANASGCPVVIQLESGHPYFALRGFEDALSPKFRSNLQRCARKAGGIELESIAVPDRTSFEEALAIEAMAWKGVAGTSIAADPRAAHLYLALLRLTGRRRQGTLHFLRAGGRRIAMLFSVEDRDTLYALKIGYDPSVANLSPGHLIVWKVAADAEARGLTRLDFVGRDDEWKRKWTDTVHETIALTIYRDTAAGLAAYALRLARPHLPPSLRGGVRGGVRSALLRGCQRGDIVGVHTLLQRVRGRLDSGLGIKSGIRRMIKPPPKRASLGAASAFAPGSWVRVKAEPELRATFDKPDRTRGLLFAPAQWETVGGVFQVAKHVRRLRDDHGRFRPVSRTVLLEGVDCSGMGAAPTGCGRHCPMMYRDEWLEPAAAGPRRATQPVATRHARVRALEEIRSGLDLRGRRDGLMFMPEMAQHAGKRFGIANEITTVFEHDRWTETRAAIYILQGLHCTGAVVGSRGPCDRACSLMWHEDWLIIES